MTVLRPRTRTINVRLSEAEYLEIERFCLSSSARSLSDLVRNTLKKLVDGASEEPALASSLSENALQVIELEHRIEKLSAEIAALRGDSRATDVAGDAGEAQESNPSMQSDGEKGFPPR